MKEMMGTVRLAALAATALLLAGTGCRRPLFVAGDEYHSAVLNTDWRNYQKNDPDGMTAWFFPEDEGVNSFRHTTSDIRRYEFYLPSGRYEGVVIDYSPEEYSKQFFAGMDKASTAVVRATASSYQPDSVARLYGPGCFHKEFPVVVDSTGLYQVLNQPEKMGLDTLHRMAVNSGEYGYYIPYEVSDTYQSHLVVQNYYAYPVNPLWRLRVRLYVKGIDYIYGIEGSVAGLADGRYLARNVATDDPCLISVKDWEIQRTGDNVGFVAFTIDTFGLLGGQRPVLNTNVAPDPYAEDPRTQMKESAVICDWDGKKELEAEDVRLNIRFLLRDRATLMYYHYDVGRHVVSYDDDQVLRVDLGADFGGHPDLPYVEPYNGAGFDADVTPWEDGGEADIPL